MTPERWRQIDELLEQALLRPATGRPEWLRRACGEDLELRQEVESLLRFTGTRDFLAQPAFCVHEEDPEIGRRIGPYRIRRLLGRGGMGAVYLAVRQGEFDQRVTLKLVRRGRDSADFLHRFQNERQILANLEHPHIARLLDGGTTEDGRPYFVMEHIEGEPIDAYCDRRKLSIAQRLALFRQVCSAVERSHQNLVVHLDLKPGNILVTADGPKLLDFGIAKLLSPEGTSPEGPDRAPMTLEFASPEQVSGQAVTTASDVYSLGVILYGLLAGHPPYRLEDGDASELRRRICEEEPNKPSAAVLEREGADVSLAPEAVSERRKSTPRGLYRRLKGDLDSIVLRTLRKPPLERYSSVEQLSEDLRRHLEGMAVNARDGNFVYRAGKLVRRHKVAAAVLLLVLVSSVTTAAGWRRASAANRQALAQHHRAESALEFLKSLFRASEPDTAKGRELTALDVLERGKERAELLEDAEHKADVLDTLGSVYRDLGVYREALLLQQRSLEISRTLHGGDHPDLATKITNLGGLVYRMGDSERAEPLFREALAMRRRLGQEEIAAARATCNLATILMHRGAFSEAEALYRACLRAREKAYGSDHPNLAMSLRSLGVLYFTWDRPNRAEPYLERAHAIHRETLEPRHTRSALTASSLGRLRLAQGRYDEAEEFLRQTLEIRLERYGDAHPDVALTKKDLAELRLERRQGERGRILLREALEVLRRTKGEDSWEVADAKSLLCSDLAESGQFEEAEPCLLESYRLLRKIRGVEAIYTRKALGRVVELYRAWGKPERSAQLRSEGRDTRPGFASRGALPGKITGPEAPGDLP